MRLLFAPQYPAKLRYQEWFFKEFVAEFTPHFDEVVLLGMDGSRQVRAEVEDFSPLAQSIEWEFQQVKGYLDMKFYDDDILLFMDVSYPGFFPQVLFHKRPNKVFGFCHATSMNTLDYFSQYGHQKFQLETGISQMCDKVFVGSHYHKQKLGWNNTVVTYLPYPRTLPQIISTVKLNEVISVARPSLQKVDLEFEEYIERKLGYEIRRPDQKNQTWEDYNKFLSRSKVMVITSCEETFGYQVVDAIMNDCIPIAPNNFSYPELLPKEYLYKSYDKGDLFSKIDAALNGELEVPDLLCDLAMKKFYRNIIEIMKG